MSGKAHDIGYQAGEVAGQAQVKKDELANKACDAAQATKDKVSQTAESARDSSQCTKEQASGFLQQTGEQVMNMAHGAADAVKNTLGINSDNSCNKSSNPSS